MPTPKLRPPPPAPDQSMQATVSLQQPSSKNKTRSRSAKLFRRVKSAFHFFPAISPPCKMPMHGGHVHIPGIGGGGKQMTGTLFGNRKARVNLAFQENPRSLPQVILELSIQTGKLLQEMGQGLVRIALECERSPGSGTKAVKLMAEPIWTMYANGRKAGYAVKRDPTDDDLKVMQLLHAASMGAGVLPAAATAEGEVAYMRAHFERVVGSKDSETYYMVSPDGTSGPELSFFFDRV